MKRFVIIAIIIWGVAIASFVRAQFLGLNLADILVARGIRVEKIMNQHGQRALRLTVDVLANVPHDKLQEGWVSWAFVPASLNLKDKKTLHEYTYDRHYGFTNDPDNLLIDADGAIPNEPVRIALFSWKCITESCDDVQDIPRMHFISDELINYHTMPVGNAAALTEHKQ